MTIAPVRASPSIPTHRSTVLMTGATGLLGRWLCVQLAAQPGTTVVCLVRAGTLDEARQRLTAALVPVLTAQPAFVACGGAHLPANVTALAGDLAMDRFGLSCHEFAGLTECLSAVVHCGASINLAASASRLWPVNVDGTARILELAALPGNIAIHHVSTAAVFTGIVHHGCEIHEDTPLPQPAGPAYIRTKLAAEYLVQRARSAGAAVTIHRPALILGDHAHRTPSTGDPLTLVAACCILTGYAPATDGGLLVATVDDTARILRWLSQMPAAAGRNLHLFPDSKLRWNHIFTTLTSLGHQIRTIPAPDWFARLSAARNLPQVRALLAIRPIIERLLDQPADPIPLLRSARTAALLTVGDPAEPGWRPIGQDFLHRHLARLTPREEPA
jgi:phthiocerol/phenolphthiocerol synthesis type-I polyketide synthase E